MFDGGDDWDCVGGDCVDDDFFVEWLEVFDWFIVVCDDYEVGVWYWFVGEDCVEFVYCGGDFGGGIFVLYFYWLDDNMCWILIF